MNQVQAAPTSLCTAHTVAGHPCSYKAKPECEGLCKRHHDMLQRAREEERRAEEEQVRQRQANRNRIVQQNQQRIDQAPAGSADTFFRYARLIADLWVTHRVPTDQLAQAYCLIRKTSVKHAEWDQFIRAVVIVLNLAHFNPDELRWANIPEAEKTNVFNNLTEAMIRLPRYDIMSALKATDSISIEFTRRRAEEREAERVARLAQQEAERQARQAEWNRRQREEAVVFKRDPEGGIDLAALGRDDQSIHRSSVQDATRKSVEILAARSVPEEMEALVEITLAFNDPEIRFRNSVKDQALIELTNDYYNTEAFSQQYGYILDRVWAYIRVHAERSELVRRLVQEVVGGIGMCVNGKMAHLINTLYAYDEDITAVMQNETPPREIFQAKFATLLNLPLNERSAAATAIFNEYKIPEAEREEWLNPLLATE